MTTTTTTPTPTPTQTPTPTLLDLRRAAGLTQTQLADRVGCRQHTISDLERGVSHASLSLARRLAAALGVTIDVIAQALDAGTSGTAS